MVKPVKTSIANTDAFGFTSRNWTTMNAIFENFSSVKEVVLFGSRAMGNYRPYSDVDLCIMNDDFDEKQLILIINSFEESDLPYFTDVLLFRRIGNGALKEAIQSTGKLIYSKAL